MPAVVPAVDADAAGASSAASGAREAAVAEPPGIFARATADEPLEGRTFLLPGISYVGWQPLDRQQASRAGAGLELSLVRWLGSGVYVGGFGQVDRLDRFRIGGGFEAGYQMIGLELGVVRDLPTEGTAGQWSLQVGPYASLGVVFVAPRWIIALDRRKLDLGPGDGVILVVGAKIPVALGGR
jgi:hypothetical protein